MIDDVDQQWHRVLSERNRLRGELEALIDAQRRYHDDYHSEAVRWCEEGPCRVLSRLRDMS